MDCHKSTILLWITDRGVIIGQLPPRLEDKGMAGPGLLADVLASPDGELSVDTARDIPADIATALVSMKMGRVVHRDIKPHNILLLDGRWCLADFGISRYAEATTAEDTRKYARTAPYAAPEQWRGERATNATDVYAFGVVAYQLCTGELPFIGPELHNYRQQHLHEIPKPIAGIPPDMASLVDGCLMKIPDARPSPETILSGLGRSPKPQSAAEVSLQAANARIVRRQLEQTRKESAERSELERREGLYECAEASLERIAKSLIQRIRDLAPASTVNWNWSDDLRFTLGNAILSVAHVSKADITVTWDDKQRKIAAYSEILLSIPRDHDEQEGRSHPLWYYQEDDDNGFGWYELAFTYDIRFGMRSRINPFALPPRSADVEFALRRDAVHTINVEEHACPIDQGKEADFIKRWIDRFAEGA